jgi:hypothetical protein
MNSKDLYWGGPSKAKCLDLHSRTTRTETVRVGINSYELSKAVTASALKKKEGTTNNVRLITCRNIQINRKIIIDHYFSKTTGGHRK